MSMRRRTPGDVTFNQLRTFKAVAQAGSFAKAAEQLDISQPTVSELIRAFEDRLDRSLFLRRNGAAASLTPSGKEVLENVDRILEIYDGMLCREKANREKTVVKISLGTHLREIFLRPFLPKIYHDHPGVEIEISSILLSTQIEQAMESRAVDLAVFALSNDAPVPAGARLICDVQMALIGAPGTRARLATGACRLEDLQYIFPIRRSLGRRLTTQMLDRLGITPRIPPLYVEFVDVLMGMVEQGEGVGAIQTYLAADRVADGRVEVLDVALPSVRRMIIRSPHAPPVARDMERILLHALRT